MHTMNSVLSSPPRIEIAEKVKVDVDSESQNGVEEVEGIANVTFDFEKLGSETLNGTYVLPGDKETENNNEVHDCTINSQDMEPAAISNPPDHDGNEKAQQEEEKTNESFEIIKEMSEIFNTKLSTESLRMCTELLVDGADPNALAQIIKTWRRQQKPPPTRTLGHLFDPLEVPKKKEDWKWN